VKRHKSNGKKLPLNSSLLLFFFFFFFFFLDPIKKFEHTNIMATKKHKTILPFFFFFFFFFFVYFFSHRIQVQPRIKIASWLSTTQKKTKTNKRKFSCQSTLVTTGTLLIACKPLVKIVPAIAQSVTTSVCKRIISAPGLVLSMDTNYC